MKGLALFENLVYYKTEDRQKWMPLEEDNGKETLSKETGGKP
jgi:hypothetical protein